MEAEKLQLKSLIESKLVETGEKAKLKEFLRQRLVESGWRDELKSACKEVIRSKGLESITVDALIAEMTPKGRSLVPDNVRAELLGRIRKFLQENE